MVVSGLLVVAGVLLCLAGEVVARSGVELTAATLLLVAGAMVLAIGLAILVYLSALWAGSRIATQLASLLVSRCAPATARRVSVVLATSAPAVALALGLLILSTRLTGAQIPLIEIPPATFLERGIPGLTIYILTTASIVTLLYAFPTALVVFTAMKTSRKINEKIETK
jgi:hypothetical protein